MNPMIAISRDRVWNALRAIAAVAFAGVVAGCGGGDPASSQDARDAAHAAKSQARVAWNPGVLQVKVLQGTSQRSSIQFTVSDTVDNASLFVVPEIAGLMQVSLLGRTVLNPGAPITVPIELSVSASTSLGLYEGTVHVRSLRRTLPDTLKVQIQVVQGSSTQVVNEVSNPAPDRIGTDSTGNSLVVDELVVVLERAAVDRETRIKEIAGQVGAFIIGSVPPLPVYQLRIAGANIQSLPIYAAIIRAQPGVKSVSRNFLASPIATIFPPPTDDASFLIPDNIWDDSRAAGINRSLEFINAPNAWKDVSENVVDHIAMIDQEFDYLHPDIITNLGRVPKIPTSTSFSFLPNTPLADKINRGHGTKVAGAICAAGNNGSGVTGVAQACKLELIEPNWMLVGTRGVRLVTAINWLMMMNQATTLPSSMVRVVNISFNFNQANCSYFPNGNVASQLTCTDSLNAVTEVNDILEEAVRDAPNVLWVIGAGNEGRDARYASPASLAGQYPEHKDNMIVVAAADIPASGIPIGDPLVLATNPFANNGSNYGDLVDVAAPSIVATTSPRECDPNLPNEIGCNNEKEAYLLAGGTSMAAPQVTGLAALVMAKHRDKTTPKQIKDCISNGSSARVESNAFIRLSGAAAPKFKVIDAAKAVECAPPTPSVSSVTVTPAFPTVGDQATISVEGTNLVPGYSVTLLGCSAIELASASTNLRQFVCALTVAGPNVAGSIATPSGTVLANFSVSVAAESPPPAAVPLVSNLSPTAMVANGQAQTLTISGSGFTDGNLVQFRWGVGAGSGVWTNSASPISSVDATQIVLPVNPGTVADTINVRVCRSPSETSDSDCFIATQAVAVTAPPNGPDLVVQNPTFSPVSVAPSGRAQVNFVVANVGPGAAAASIGSVRLNQSSSSSAGLDAAVFAVAALPSGGTFNVAVAIPAPLSAGTYYLWVIADRSGTSGENAAVATNNSTRAAATLAVTGGSATGPVVTSISVDPPLLSIDTLAVFSVNGRNLQAGYTLAFPGCAASELASTSTTLRQFACTLTQAGLDLAGNLTAASGELLYSFALSVNQLTFPTASRISAGTYDTCAITDLGGAKCWGYNIRGQLGDGTLTNRLMPVEVLGLGERVIALAPGEQHTCALTASGGVKCWGYNGVGNLGDGTKTNRLTPGYVFGLRAGVVAIAAGNNHTCAVTTSGGVKCWGNNPTGGIGDGGPKTIRLVPVDVSGLSSGVIALAAGLGHTCALLRSGGVKCWGFNFYGQLGDGSGNDRLTPVDVLGLSSGVIAVSAGARHTCAVTNAGGVKCWGNNGVGQLGDGSGTNRLMPVDVFGLSSGAIAVAGGHHSTCALTAGGGAKCWGGNSFGEVGNDTRLLQRTPVDVLGLSGSAEELSAGSYHMCVRTTVGVLRCWGYNRYGQVGDGTRSDRWTPVDVLGY
jgi:alpha-tubulin suppressor-like RCC1 family protein